MNKKQWFLDQAISGIPGPLERKQVRAELEEHLDDHASERMRLGESEEASYLEAVEAMGDVKELAERLGQIHAYDTAAAFSRMVGVLWFGILLCMFRAGNEGLMSIEAWIGRTLVLAALYRLRGVNRRLNEAFGWQFLSFAAALFCHTFHALPWETVRIIGVDLMKLIETAAGIGVWICLYRGFRDLADIGGDTVLAAGYLLQIVLGGAVIVRILIGLANGTISSGFRLEISGGFVLFLVPVLVVLFCVFWYRLWKVKKQIQENGETGIGPFAIRKAIPYLFLAGVIAASPAAVSYAVSVWPVSRYAYVGGRAQDQEVWNRVEEKLSWDSRENQTVQGDAWDMQRQGMTERLGRVLPWQELIRLQEAETIRIFWSEEEEVIWILAQMPKPEQGSCRIGCLKTWSSPLEGYAAISSFWLSGPAGTSSEKIEYETLLLSEKNGQMEYFLPRMLYTEETMMAAEYSMDRKADQVYCYQAMNIQAPESEAAARFMLGTEQALQKLPLRIPYDAAIFQPANALGQAGEDLSGRLLFEQGIVRWDENQVWKQSGDLVSVPYGSSAEE